MQLQGVEAVDGHEGEGIKNGDEVEKNTNRAEADEELRKRKPGARPYAPTDRSTSTKSLIYPIVVGVGIVSSGGALQRHTRSQTARRRS